MWPVLRAGWIRWCATILLALLAVSLLHAMAPHGATQRDCSACKILDSPGVTQVSGGFSRPVAKLSEMPVLSPARPLCASARYHRPLRAPPESPVL